MHIFVLCQDVDECETVECANGGTCINQVGSFYCDCPQGYTGDYCIIGLYVFPIIYDSHKQTPFILVLDEENC